MDFITSHKNTVWMVCLCHPPLSKKNRLTDAAFQISMNIQEHLFLVSTITTSRIWWYWEILFPLWHRQPHDRHQAAHTAHKTAHTDPASLPAGFSIISTPPMPHPWPVDLKVSLNSQTSYSHSLSLLLELKIYLYIYIYIIQPFPGNTNSWDKHAKTQCTLKKRLEPGTYKAWT